VGVGTRTLAAACTSRSRPFAGTKLCCAKTRWNGETCGGLGAVHVQPVELLRVGAAVTLAFLFCRRCVPPWEIRQVQLE
jgi:hypothetical protein